LHQERSRLDDEGMAQRLGDRLRGKGAGYAGTGYRGYAYYGAPVGYADYGSYGPFGMVNGLFRGLFGW